MVVTRCPVRWVHRQVLGGCVCACVNVVEGMMTMIYHDVDFFGRHGLVNLKLWTTEMRAPNSVIAEP